jgi:arsenate reductase (thioredoxin)
MKRVMFVCKENSIYSQIAESFAKHLGIGFFETVTSAGVEPLPIKTETIAIMKNSGIDISRQISKPLTDFCPADFDIVILFSDLKMSLPSEWMAIEYFTDWQIDNSVTQFRMLWQVRDEIRAKVVELIESLQVKQVKSKCGNLRHC